MQFQVSNTATGYLVLVNDIDGTVTFDFDDIDEKARDLTAQLTVSRQFPGENPEMFTERINILSSSAKDGLRKSLNDLWDMPKGHWTGIINKACEAMRMAHRERDWGVNLGDVIVDSHASYLLRPLVPDQGHTIWFAAGEAGKTYIALATALCVAYGDDTLGYEGAPRPVLYVDYESGEQIVRRRLNKLAEGMGLTLTRAFWTEMFHYWPGRGPIGSMIPALRRKVSQGLSLMFVDSAALAAGGNPVDEQVALGYFNALRQLNIPCVTLAHTNKAEEDRWPLGSIFWSTSARATWNVKSEEEMVGNVKRIGFYQRKGNEDERHRPVGFNLSFNNGVTEIERTEISGELAEHQSLKTRIRRSLMKHGKLTAKELSDELGVKNQDTVSRELRRMSDVMSEGERGSHNMKYCVIVPSSALSDEGVR